MLMRKAHFCLHFRIPFLPIHPELIPSRETSANPPWHAVSVGMWAGGRHEVGAGFGRTELTGPHEAMARKPGNTPGGGVYPVRWAGGGVLHFRSCADGRGFPPRG